MSNILSQLAAKGFKIQSTATAEPEAKKPATAEPEAKKPVTVEPEVKKPVTVEPEVKKSKTKTTSKKVEPEEIEVDAVREDTVGTDVVLRKNEITIDNGVKLPSIESLLSGGKPMVVGLESVIQKTLVGFLPITWLKIAQAIKYPQYIGKIIYGSDDNIKIFDKAVLPLVFHAWERKTDFEGQPLFKPQATITVFFYSPEDDELYAMSAKNYELDAVKKLGQKEFGYWNIEAEAKAIKFKKNGKEQSSTVHVPVFTPVEQEFELDPEILKEKLEVVEQHLTNFFAEFPDQSPVAEEIPF
jgi:hypothetical protein